MSRVLCALFIVIVLSVPLLSAEKVTIAVMDFETRDIFRNEALKISELITFLGRYAANANAANGIGQAGSIAVYVPPEYFPAIDFYGRGRFNLGLGVSMKF